MIKYDAITKSNSCTVKVFDDGGRVAFYKNHLTKEETGPIYLEWIVKLDKGWKIVIHMRGFE